MVWTPPGLVVNGYTSTTIRELAMRRVIGLEIAKRVFQLHSVDQETGELQRSKLQRSELLEHFGNLTPSIVAIEACGEFGALGSKVYGDGSRGATDCNQVRAAVRQKQQD